MAVKKIPKNDISAKIDVIGKKLDDKIDRIISAMVTKDELRSLEERLAEIERTNQHIAIATDGMVGTYDTLYTEYAAIKHQLSRHDRWFEELSKRTGAKLEY
jgi:hypothetical protein